MRRKRFISGILAVSVSFAVSTIGLGRIRDPPAEARFDRSGGTGIGRPRSGSQAASSRATGAPRTGRGRAGGARQAFAGKVVGVSDGDTLSVLRRSTSGGGETVRAVKVRLEGIDCPESGQAFGRRAKELTSRLAFGKEVRIEVRDVDRYSRLVARVVLPDGRDLSKELVRAGLAWWYRKYSKDPELEALEAQARKARRGLWAGPRTERLPPWVYRGTRKAR